VRGVNVGEAAASRENCARLRDELWFKGREWFQDRSCSIPQDDALIAELSTPTYAFTSSGKMFVESKADLKKRGIRSPDLADALLPLRVAKGGRSAIEGQCGGVRVGLRRACYVWSCHSKVWASPPGHRHSPRAFIQSCFYGRGSLAAPGKRPREDPGHKRVRPGCQFFRERLNRQSKGHLRA
jgi:hypothetical protein